MTLRRVVAAVQALAVLASLAFVVLLFVDEPGGTKAPATPATAAAAPSAGQAVYTAECAKCHGARGQGGLGPQLAGGRMAERYPDAADQVAVVARGRGGMPAFGNSLSAEQIAAVVAYTRTEL